MKVVLLAAILALAVTQASGFTGIDLYQFCIVAQKGTLGDATCTTYVRGFIDGLIIGTFVTSKDWKISPPDAGIPVAHGRLILENYLRNHPEVLNEDGGYLFGFAMIDAFRCPSN